MHFTVGCRQQEAELRAGLARSLPAPNPARPGPRSSGSPEWRCLLPSFKHHLQEHMPILPSLARPPVRGCPLRGSERRGRIRGRGRRAEPRVSAAALGGEWRAVARGRAKEPPAAERAAPGPVAPSNLAQPGSPAPDAVQGQPYLSPSHIWLLSPPRHFFSLARFPPSCSTPSLTLFLPTLSPAPHSSAACLRESPKRPS